MIKSQPTIWGFLTKSWPYRFQIGLWLIILSRSEGLNRKEIHNFPPSQCRWKYIACIANVFENTAGTAHTRLCHVFYPIKKRWDEAQYIKLSIKRLGVVWANVPILPWQIEATRTLPHASVITKHRHCQDIPKLLVFQGSQVKWIRSIGFRSTREIFTTRWLTWNASWVLWTNYETLS